MVKAVAESLNVLSPRTWFPPFLLSEHANLGDHMCTCRASHAIQNVCVPAPQGFVPKAFILTACMGLGSWSSVCEVGHPTATSPWRRWGLEREERTQSQTGNARPSHTVCTIELEFYQDDTQTFEVIK